MRRTRDAERAHRAAEADDERARMQAVRLAQAVRALTLVRTAPLFSL